MFEDSLVESRVGQVSSSKRWTMLASIGLQVAVAGVVLVLPLLHPEAMPFRLEAPKVLMPLLPKPPVPVVVERASAASSSSVAMPSETQTASLTPTLPSIRPVVGDPPLAVIGSGMRMTDALPGGIVGSGSGPVVSLAPARAPLVPLHVSTGVLQGMLLAPIRPVYPVIAKAAGVQGTVVVEAVISRKGTIESLRVVSGPLMLQNAALDAIREARYRPFRLNGEPTEVQTTITVNFRMGG
jgi:periplasmic protein TonB